MSTNFYWTPHGLQVARREVDDVRARRPPRDETHLGKRWAAGWYCERCACWLEQRSACPRCGSALAAAERENSDPLHLVCGFTWAQDPEVVGGVCRVYCHDVLVEDECDGHFYGGEFLEMLARSVRRTVVDLVGVPDFS